MTVGALVPIPLEEENVLLISRAVETTRVPIEMWRLGLTLSL